MAEITFTDKQSYFTSPFADIYKLTASNVNEIKDSVNALYDAYTNVFSDEDYTLPNRELGEVVTVTNTSASFINVIGQINGETNFTLYPNESLSVAYNGTQWRVI